jgi:hypothetical protein
MSVELGRQPLFSPSSREHANERHGEAGGPPPFEEQHFPTSYWAGRWGFSSKTIREWFRDEFGPGILRQQNSGRRSKRDYTTLMIAPSAAMRVYLKRTRAEVIH